MRELSALSSWWKRTVFLRAALYSFTGMFTRPKLIAPLQIARAMACKVPGSARRATRGSEIARRPPYGSGVPDDRRRLGIRDEALERRRPERARPRPLAELHPRHEARLHEERLLRWTAAWNGFSGDRSAWSSRTRTPIVASVKP